MSGKWSTLIMLSFLATSCSYEVTMLEDVVAEYDFETFKKVFINATQHLMKAIDSLENKSSSKSQSLMDLKESVDGMTQSLTSLTQETNSIKDTVTKEADSTKGEIKSFKDQLMSDLSTLKTLIESKVEGIEQSVSSLNEVSEHLLAGDCQDLYDLGFNASGVYFLQKFGRQVLCDMETDDGGWLVIQQREQVDEQVDFNQDWQGYKSGFGDLESEFWAGNDFLHILTNQKSYSLRVDMIDYERGPYWAVYSTFRVGSESSGYVLDIGDYLGNATDAFTYHHGRPFTSTDYDNDLYDGGNCAVYFSGGWWYDRCYDAHLNGIYPVVPDRHNASYITWWAFEEGKKVPLVLTSVTIKVKPNSS